jgi:[ribosomal protein S5]-alanine N-acetyltransferase
MQNRIETERLILRPFEVSDAGAAFAWFGDPVVMRFTPTGPDKSFEDTEARLALFMEHQKAHGFSKWLVLNRASGVAIGDSGLLVLRDYGWIDLGFRLAQPYWGKGFATEVASVWVRAAFDEFGLGRLGAFAHPENRASIRVLETLGFIIEDVEWSSVWTQSCSRSTQSLPPQNRFVELTLSSDHADPNRFALAFWILQACLLCLLFRPERLR